MTYIFSRSNAATLDRFLTSRVLVAFDFDGTLAPIVVNRTTARMRRRTHQLLERLCRLYPCAVISGRGLQDLRCRLEGLPFRHVVGNHGLVSTGVASPYAKEMAFVRAEIEETIGRREGVEVEDKINSVAIHYRRAPHRRSVGQEIERALSGLSKRCRILPGKLVFDVVPRSAPHKGDALVHIRDEELLDAAIYVGDDATDEDVFRTTDRERLLSIRIGRSRLSAASYFVRDQRELDHFLDHLVRVRSALTLVPFVNAQDE